MSYLGKAVEIMLFGFQSIYWGFFKELFFKNISFFLLEVYIIHLLLQKIKIYFSADTFQYVIWTSQSNLIARFENDLSHCDKRLIDFNHGIKCEQSIPYSKHCRNSQSLCKHPNQNLTDQNILQVLKNRPLLRKRFYILLN